MFFDKIYESWKGAQFEKYEFVLDYLDYLVLERSKNFWEETEKEINILDIGCGPFYFEDFLENNLNRISWLCDKSVKLVSTDVYVPPVLSFKKFKTIKNLFVLSDGAHLPFKRYFDLIFCFDSVHLFDPSEIHNYLKSDGILVVSLPVKFSERVVDINGFEIIDEKNIHGRENEIFRFYILSGQSIPRR